MGDLSNTSQTVINCYDFLDGLASCGITDFTDGKYCGNPKLPYLRAQENQAEWLLDQVNCESGSRILDIGCGNGRILQTAQNREAEAVGITISDKQVRRCKEQGLDVHILNYRNIPESWNGTFDGIIANGSAEHFVQVQDVIEGKQDEIYEEMFRICNRVLRPEGKFVTTIIHFNDWFEVDPGQVVSGTTNRKKFDYNYAQLVRDFGGWYPRGDQLKKCADGYFKHVSREDGTEDYRITSETWLSNGRRIVLTNPKAWGILTLKLAKNPKVTLRFLDDLMVKQSWMRQFRDWEGNGTPTKLYRDVWQRAG